MIPAHGGQLRRLAAQYGLRPESILDFSANINPEGPPDSVIRALRAALERPETLTAYPDLELYALRSALSRHLDVGPETLALANGFVPLLEAVVRTRGLRRCLLPVPAFGEYRRTLEQCGVAVSAFPLGEEFGYEPQALIDAARAADADSLLLANPQNPSGVLAAPEVMLRLLEGAAAADLHVLLDEAFIDYAPAASLVRAAPVHAKLVVFRSVTKFFAMPGLRVAYAVMSSAASVNAALPPWPISTLAAEAVIAALGDSIYEQRTRNGNRTRRQMLELGLQEIGLATCPGAAANFLLLHVPHAAVVWESLLRDHQILLRSCLNFEGLGQDFLRTAVRTEADNGRLLDAIEMVLRSDMFQQGR